MSKRAARQGDHNNQGDLVSATTEPFTAGGDDGFQADGSLFGRARQPRNPLSHAQIEIVLSRSVAAVAVIFALQTLPVMLEQLDSRKASAAVPIAIVLALVIVIFVTATLLRQGIRTSAGAVSAVYLAALFVWPLLMLDPAMVLESKPWLWYLCGVATSCAAIALPLGWAVVYTVVTPVAFGLLRVLPSGGEAENLLAMLDTFYAMLLGGTVLIIIYVLRQATTRVDTAQSNALAKYAVAVRHHATEVERVEVDSIVHDSVLATLLSAAGVRNAKGAELAAAMARSAIIRLQAASGERNLDDAAVTVSQLTARLRSAATAAGQFTVTELCVAGLTLPEHAAEALYSASVQAMVNSVQHAGPAQSRSVTVGGDDQSGCVICISDTGRGFDVSSVASARLGLRVSIHDRVATAGGVAVLRTSLGHGTTITLTWPRPDEPNDASGDQSAEAGAPSRRGAGPR
ncbi:sensor histidine kinase [Cryobacterium serini]|uniref:ATP-binding protein n=1 Tax=Cryobacterium serini TaxID=1259201 RepID=A0A4R9BL87_9MICO|nr:ATP-binding protein [Cryobacterium serini]TFD86246.1 ATP-binding protein [Cryobacterium serini]